LQMYVEIGQPPVTGQSCWDIYLFIQYYHHRNIDALTMGSLVNQGWSIYLSCISQALQP
jgi:hypothetical protein